MPRLYLRPARAGQGGRKGFRSCHRSLPLWNLPSVWARGGLLLPWWLGGGGGEWCPGLSVVPQSPSHCPPLWAVRPGRPLTLPTSWLGPGVRTCLCTQRREVARPTLALPPITFPPMPFIGCLLCTRPTASSFNPLHFLRVLRFACFTRGRARSGCDETETAAAGWEGVGGSWSPGCGLRALFCRLPVSLSQHLSLSGPQPPLPPSWPGSFPASLSSSNFLWVDRETGGVSFAVLIQGCAGRSSGGPRDHVNQW